MKPSNRRISAAPLLAAFLFAASAGHADGLPAYRTLAPLLSAEVSNLAETVSHMTAGLTGVGVETTAEECRRQIADFLLLPDLAGADPLKPVRYFLLAQNPPTTLPDPAIILPVGPNGPDGLVQSLRKRYATVGGGSIKTCVGPLDGKAVEPLYVAIAEGNALISANIDAIRWMAYHLQAGTLPKTSAFRNATLAISIDGPLAGLALGRIVLPDARAMREEATTDNTFLHVRELGSFASSFQRIDVAVDASLSQWDVSFRFAPPPGSALDEAIGALAPPADFWMNFFPPFASVLSASDLPAFIAALPASNRRWLASLAENTHILGFGIIPSSFDLDEKLRPFLTGTGLATFVADKPTGRFGSVSVAGIKSPADAKAVLRGYFSTNGSAARNPRIRSFSLRGEEGPIAYDTADRSPAAAGSSLGHAGEAVSQLLDLDHVEIAVKDRHLVIARGARGLIDHWLADRPVAPWAQKIARLTSAFPDHPGETILGGGSAEPVSLIRKIISGTPDLAHLLPKIPHAGSGVAWRMARRNGDAIFDLRLHSNELLACNLLRGTGSAAMEEFLSQLVMRDFQRSTEAKTRRKTPDDKLDEPSGK